MASTKTARVLRGWGIWWFQVMRGVDFLSQKEETMSIDDLLTLVGKQVRGITKGKKDQTGIITHVIPAGRVVVKIEGRKLQIWKLAWFVLEETGD